LRLPVLFPKIFKHDLNITQKDCLAQASLFNTQVLYPQGTQLLRHVKRTCLHETVKRSNH